MIHSEKMQTIVRTDNHLHGSTELADQVAATVDAKLGHLRNQLTRVEVFLADENSFKAGGGDIRCTMEARIEGHPPLAVTHHADDLTVAVDGATAKLKAALRHLFGRLHDR